MKMEEIYETKINLQIIFIMTIQHVILLQKILTNVSNKSKTSSAVNLFDKAACDFFLFFKINSVLKTNIFIGK